MRRTKIVLEVVLPLMPALLHRIMIIVQERSRLPMNVQMMEIGMKMNVILV